MSTTNVQHRSLDAVGLRRMQDLDKSFFGGGAGRNKSVVVNTAVDDNAPAQSSGYSGPRPAPWPSNGVNGAMPGSGQLPPLMAAWPDHGLQSVSSGPDALLPGRLGNGAGLGQSLTLGPSQGPQRLGAAPQRPRTVGSNSGPGQRRAANAKPPRRAGSGPGLEPITLTASYTAGGGPNPWEALLDAAPATRYSGAPARDAGGLQLQLLMPSGSSRESMISFEQRLTSHLQPASGPSGTAAVGGGAHRGGGGGAGSSPSRMPPSPTRPMAVATAGAGGSYSPSMPYFATGDGHSPGGAGMGPSPGSSSLPPLVPRSALHSALAAPPVGAEQPWGGAGLPYGTHGAMAELRGGMVAGVAATGRETFEHGGMNAAAAIAAAAADVGEAWDDPQSPPSLSQMISGRPSNRRQVQLMADWLDTQIGVLWEQHVAAYGSGSKDGAAPSTGSGAAGGMVSENKGDVGFGAGGGGSADVPSPTAAQARRAAAAAAAGAGGSGKAALAMRFGSITAGLRDLSTNLYGVATQPQLWAAMVEATGAVANAVVQNVAHRCWEEGALLARLWNLHTALMDSGLAAARRSQEQLAATTEEQAAKIRRLDPLIDWELESRSAREELTNALEGSRAEALLAGRERDALLRENDKIIAHYRKELKTYRREQRRNAYRLARKLRNTQQQLELMTRDRDILYNAVSYTKSQTAQLVDLIGGMHGHLRSVITTGAGSGSGSGAGPAKAGSGVSFAVLNEEGFPELSQIETGLKNILHSVTKVRDVNQDAEDSHFVVEEQVTAVAAADTVGDELVDEVLAEGDPEPSPEEEAAEAAMAAAAAAAERRQQVDSESEYDSDEPDPHSALSMLAEAALRGTGDSSEEEGGQEVDAEGREAKADGGGPLEEDSSELLREATGEEDPDAVLLQEELLQEELLQDELAAAETAEEAAALEEELRLRQQANRSLSRAGSRSPNPRGTNSPAPPGNGDGTASGDASGRRTPVSRSDTADITASTHSPGPASPSVLGNTKKKNKSKNKGRGEGGTSQRGFGGAVAGSVAGRISPGGGGGSGVEGRRTPGGGGGGGSHGADGRASPGGGGGSGGHSSHGGLTPNGGRSGHHGGGGGHGGNGSRGLGGDGHGGGGSGGHAGYSFSATTPPTGTPMTDSSVDGPMSALPRRRFNVASVSSQTGAELLRGVADPELAEAARQMGKLREALSEIGIMGNPNDDADGTDGLLTALRQYMTSLSQESGTLTKQLEKLRTTAEAAESARADLAQTAEARGREVAAVRRELLESKKRHSQLCDALEALGIDPRSPRVPSQGDGLDGLRAVQREGSAQAAGGKGGKGGRGGDSSADTGRNRGGKVSKLAAVKEKARERAAQTTVPHAPVLGRSSITARALGSTSASAGPTSRVQLPAAMLAAAQQRAAEAAASGETDAAGGGNVAASISAWRAGGGGAGGGGGAAGPTPVYIRPDRAAATARLQDALMRYADVKPRTQEWLLKLIDSMYRGKATSDEQRSKIGQEPLTLIEYMFQHLSGVYGTKDLVNQYAAQLVATCLQYCGADPRVGTFQRFLMEEWDTRTLCAYMDATRKLQEPTRVPCCDFPPDYVGAGGRKGDSWPVDVRKALWVAERVLMRRSPKASYVFSQLLTSRAEAISGSEMDSYFVSPGSYGAELQQVRQYELGRGEFKRVSSAVFLDALCGEYARMENVFREMLPEIFSQYDGDADGWITRQDVTDMFGDMVADMAQMAMQLPDSAAQQQQQQQQQGGAGISEQERDAALEALWTALTTAEADARNRADSTMVYPDGATRGPGGGMVAPSAVTHLSDSGFLEGAFRSDFVRAWVRAFKTGAAHLPGGVGALAEMDQHAARESARRLLSVMVTRHWAHHGETLEGFFGDAGALAEQQLRQQAAMLEGEMGGPHGDGRDGPRRAAALCTVLRLLLVKKADRFSSLLTAEGLTGGPHNGPTLELEDLMSRLTAAVRLLYGPADSIWVVGAEIDELEALGGLDAADVEALPPGYKRWIATVAVRCCALHDRLHLSLPPSPIIPQLQNHRSVSYYARMWRRATVAAVAARRRATVASRTPPFAAMRHASSTVSTTSSSAAEPRPLPPSSPVGKVVSSTSGNRRPGSGAMALGRPGSPARPGSGTARPSSRSSSSRPSSAARQRSVSPSPLLTSSGSTSVPPGVVLTPTGSVTVPPPVLELPTEGA